MIRDVLGKVVDVFRLVKETVLGVRDARRANVNDALNGYASGRSAHDAASIAGHEREQAHQAGRK